MSLRETWEFAEGSLWYAAAAKLLQLCPTLCDPTDGSPPGSPVPGILQARTLEWVAISFSNAWKWKVKVKLLSRVWLFVTPWTAPTRLLRPWDFPGKSTGVRCHYLLRHCDIIPFKTHCTSIWETKLHVYSNTHTQCVYICVCLCLCLLYIDPFSLFQETHILSADHKGSLICSGYPHPLVLATLKCGLRSPGFLLTVIIFSQNFYVWLCILPWFLFPTF